MFPSTWRVFQQDIAKSHTAAITTAWLRSGRVRVLNWPECSPDISPIENIWRIIKRKIHQRGPRTLSSWKPISGKNGTNSNTKTPETHNLDAQTSSNCFEKKRRCYTMVNMPPSQLETCSRHQIWNELILCINCKIAQFKHLLCYLCSIVNTILAHVIRNSGNTLEYCFLLTA